MAEIRELLESLQPDPWRDGVGFSEDLSKCSAVLVSPVSTGAERRNALRTWIAREQPCVFGRLAAGAPDLISFCILTDQDLHGSDDEISSRIQVERSHWKQRASEGEKSNFIIVAASEQLLRAKPDENLKNLAVRLFELYLIEEKQILLDSVYQDWVFLYDFPPTGFGRWFGVGANFFGAQGDKRWWHDHRFPGGIAFSMNSPGHMARSGAQRLAFLEAYNKVLEGSVDTSSHSRIDQLRLKLEEYRKNNVFSLSQVLRFAMLTIRNASEQLDPQQGSVWSKATALFRRDSQDKCPFAEIDEDPKLEASDCNYYLGWYHTDYTIPVEYFRDGEVERPKELVPFALDFSYIHNPLAHAYKEFSEGVKVTSPISRPQFDKQPEEK